MDDVSCGSLVQRDVVRYWMDYGEETPRRYCDIASSGKEGDYWVGPLVLATADMRYRDIASAETEG